MTPLTDPVDPDNIAEVDHDPRDFREAAPSEAIYVLPEARIDRSAYFRSAGAALKTRLDRVGSVTIWRNRELSLYGRVDEDRSAFEARCRRNAHDAADEEAARLRDKYEKRLRTAREQFKAAERRERELKVDVEGARSAEWTDLAGTVIDFLSGRRSSGSRTSRRRASTRSKQERLASARDKADARKSAIEELNNDLESELGEIEERWDEAAPRVEAHEIGLERTDISIDGLMLAWLPV